MTGIYREMVCTCMTPGPAELLRPGEGSRFQTAAKQTSGVEPEENSENFQ